MADYGDIEKGFPGMVVGFDSKIITLNAKKEIRFGRPVFGYKGEDNAGYPFAKDVSIVAFDVDFVEANVVDVDVLVEGVSLGTAQITVPATPDQAVEILALANAISAITGVEAIVDSSDVDDRSILVRVQGQSLVTTAIVTLGAGQAVATITYGSSQVFMGISTHTQKESAGIAQFDITDPAGVCTDGEVYSDCSTASVYLNEAFVDDNGEFANAGVSVGAIFSESIGGTGLVKVKLGSIVVAMSYADQF